MMRCAKVLLLAAMTQLAAGTVKAQSPIDVYELADYRLTPEVFVRFVEAGTRISDVIQQDSSFDDAPLFTKEILLSGDAVAEATGLAARLEHHTGLAAALEAARLTPREYAKFAITLIAAHLAHRFINSGALKRVPSGAPTINVEFIKNHDTDVTAALATLGIRD